MVPETAPDIAFALYWMMWGVLASLIIGNAWRFGDGDGDEE